MTNCAIFIISTDLYELPLCLEKLLLCKCRHVPVLRDGLIAVEETGARLAGSGICLRTTCLSCCWPIQTSFSKMSMTSQNFILLFFPTFFPWTIAGLLASVTTWRYYLSCINVRNARASAARSIESQFCFSMMSTSSQNFHHFCLSALNSTLVKGGLLGKLMPKVQSNKIRTYIYFITWFGNQHAYLPFQGTGASASAGIASFS